MSNAFVLLLGFLLGIAVTLWIEHGLDSFSNRNDQT